MSIEDPINITARLGALGSEELLGRDRVLQITGLSKTHIYRMMAMQAFPQPIKVGRRSLWLMSEVQAWVCDTITAARDTNGHQAGTKAA